MMGADSQAGGLTLDVGTAQAVKERFMMIHHHLQAA